MTKEFIKLNAGDPDVEAPQYAINEALIAIIEGGMNTHYPHYSGYPDRFKESVVQYYKKFTGVEYKPDDVIPAAGSSAAVTPSIMPFCSRPCSAWNRRTAAAVSAAPR